MGKQILTIDKIKQIVTEISKSYGVERALLFGSYARGEENINSDIDLRIDKGKIKGLFQLSGYHLDLEEKLNTNVDVLTTESLSKKFLESTKEEEIILYEQ